MCAKGIKIPASLTQSFIYLCIVMALAKNIKNVNSTVLKVLVFAATAIIISFMIPNQKKFRYEFQKNKPWLYDDLAAPFDFPVLKSQAEYDEDKAGVNDNYKPFFNLEPSIKNSVIDKLKTELLADSLTSSGVRKSDETLALQTEENLLLGIAIISNLYKYPIIADEKALPNRNKNAEITLINGKYAEEINIANVILASAIKDSCRVIAKRITPNAPPALVTLVTSLVLPNAYFDQTLSEEMQSDLKTNLSKTEGIVSKGDLIIKRGDLIDDEAYQELESLRLETELHKGENYYGWQVNLGQLVVICTSLILLVMFLFLFRREVLKDNAAFAFLFSVVLLMTLTCWAVLNFKQLNIYVVPFCLVPIIVRAFFDTRLALYTHLITVLIVGFIIPNSFEFVFLQLTAGIIALFSIANLKKRGQLLLAAVFIFFTYAVTYTAIQLMHEGNILKIYLEPYAWFAASCAVTLLAYPSIFLFERMFALVSDVRLLELADTNSPLLKELANKAPGTFQHSLQVANLAEAVIDKIGGNALLTRTGALYHDIGKMEMPLYFIENQVQGINPHDSVEFDQSAHIIVNHVAQGIKLAQDNRIPQQIIDFIATHHGTGRVQYFYNSYIKQFPEREVDLEHFTYPGPKPFSKETAVLMMADTVEAASRSLKDHSAKAIETLVNRLIDAQIADDQFSESPISLKDIKIAKQLFCKMLGNVYHVRVEYPDAPKK